jgi:peptide/nickel transport system substrate-binding protein
MQFVLNRAVFVAVLAIALVACSPAAPAAPSTGAAPSTAAGHSLTFAVPALSTNTDRDKYDTTPHGEWTPMWITPFLRYKELPTTSTTLPAPDDVESELASSWTVQDDGVQVTLRDAKSAAGNTLSADDVKWSFDRILALKPSTTLFLMGLAGFDMNNPVTVVDSKTVHLNLKPQPLTQAMLTEYLMGILDSTEAKKHATSDDPWATTWLATNSAGYGPYVVQSFTPQQEVRMTANPNYWRGAPYYTNVVVRVVPDSSTRLQLLQAKQVDWARYLTLSDYATLNGNSAVTQVALPQLGEDYLFLNESVAPLADARVRQAMSMALDRNAIIASAYSGVGTPASSATSSTIPQMPPTPATLPAMDVAQAKSMLAAGGFGDGFDLELTTPASLSSGDVQRLAVLVQSELAQIGVRVTISSVASSSQFFSEAFSTKPSKYQAWLFSGRPVVADGAYLFNLLFTTKANSNSTGFSNPDFDSDVASALATSVGPERQSLAAKAASIFQTQLPAIPLVESKQNEAFAAGITGLSPSNYSLINVADLKPAS